MADKIVVLVHGLHLNAKGWEMVAWGDIPNNLWGTIPTGIKAAHFFNANKVIWGSGASQKGDKTEAEEMFSTAVSRSGKIAKQLGEDEVHLKDFLRERSILDEKSQNTQEEIEHALDYCQKIGAKTLVLVPAAGQASIAIKRILSLVLQNTRYSNFRHSVLIFPSDVMYEGISIDDVVIFMPPHRGDRLNNDSHVCARETLELLQRYSVAGDRESLDRLVEDWFEMLKKV